MAYGWLILRRHCVQWFRCRVWGRFQWDDQRSELLGALRRGFGQHTPVLAGQWSESLPNPKPRFEFSIESHLHAKNRRQCPSGNDGRAWPGCSYVARWARLRRHEYHSHRSKITCAGHVFYSRRSGRDERDAETGRSVTSHLSFPRKRESRPTVVVTPNLDSRIRGNDIAILWGASGYIRYFGQRLDLNLIELMPRFTGDGKAQAASFDDVADIGDAARLLLHIAGDGLVIATLFEHGQAAIEARIEIGDGHRWIDVDRAIIFD